MKAIQLLSVAAVLMVLGTTVAAAAADTGDDPVVPEERWVNADIIDNVYPDFAQKDAEDDFYAYALGSELGSLAQYKDAATAMYVFNTNSLSGARNVNRSMCLVDLVNGWESLEGPDAGVMGLYRGFLSDPNEEECMELVDTYVSEIAEMDTAEEFREFVATGGSGCFRDVYFWKHADNSSLTGGTALMMDIGAVPWYTGLGLRSPAATERLLTNYGAVLDLYFADSPETASTYLEDFRHVSSLLRDCIEETETCMTVSQAEDFFTNYPIADDLAVYREAGVEDLVFTDGNYASVLDGICSEDGYRYARAMAVYAVFYECAYHMGPEYLQLITGSPVAHSGNVYSHDVDSFVLGMFIGKYYNKYFGESYRDVVESAAERTREAAKDYFSSLRWLSGASRDRIGDKLDSMLIRVCGPTEAQAGQYDYTDALGATSFLDLDRRMRAANETISVEQCIQERGEFWPMTMLPQMLNAFHNPLDNSINLMAAYVTPSVDTAETEESILATLCTTVAHEITHAFDSTGCDYGPTGIKDEGWMFIPAENIEFESRMDMLVEFIDGIAVLDGQAHSGELTKKECTADMGGMAIVLRMAEDTDGFDYDAFFRAYAGKYARLYDADTYRDGVMFDPHMSSQFRTNTTLMQFREFLDLYGVEKGDGMYLKYSVNPWRSR